MTKAKASPWSKSDEEAVELCSVTAVMAANTQRLFLWDRPANGSAKAGRNETSCQANSEVQSFRGKVKGMQSHCLGAGVKRPAQVEGKAPPS